MAVSHTHRRCSHAGDHLANRPTFTELQIILKVVLNLRLSSYADSLVYAIGETFAAESTELGSDTLTLWTVLNCIVTTAISILSCQIFCDVLSIFWLETVAALGRHPRT